MRVCSHKLKAAYTFQTCLHKVYSHVHSQSGLKSSNIFFKVFQQLKLFTLILLNSDSILKDIQVCTNKLDIGPIVFEINSPKMIKKYFKIQICAPWNCSHPIEYSYILRTLRACCSQSELRILKIHESNTRALFLYNCTLNTLHAR